MAVVGIDLGGSGSRIAIVGERRTEFDAPPFAVVGGHARHAHAVRALARRAEVREPIDAVAVSAAGLISLGDPSELGSAIADLWPNASVLIVSDAVAAVMGSWDLAGGAVVAAGTGVIAFATDFRHVWSRSDGWGHLLGDDGGGAWIGGRGLAAALREVDGRPGGSPRLLEALREEFGEPLRVPDALRSASNPAAVLASFAPSVSAAALQGDRVAGTIIVAAARELAFTGVSVLGEPVPQRLGLVGGLSRDPVIAEAFVARIHELRPDLTVAVGSGTPLDGAVALAQHATAVELTSRPPYLVRIPPQISRSSTGAAS